MAAGVQGPAGTQGNARALHAAAVKAKERTVEELEAKSAAAKRLGLKPTNRWKGSDEWTDEQLKLLGTDHDDVIARGLRRTLSAVRS